MNFNSLAFFLFLGVILVLHHALPWRFGRWVLVAASYVFYGVANPWYCLLLLSSTLIDFVVAQRIEASETRRSRKALLLISLCGNLGLLGIFKYADLGIVTANSILAPIGFVPIPVMELLLPVGISFYTFQTLSYTIDVYRGETRATRDFASFALYVSFFPQLVAGPIERAHRLLPQLSRKQKVTLQDFEIGFQRILWGLVKKIVVADRLGILVDEVYANPGEASTPVLILAAMCFAFQLYLDFSAYSDIAIGSARLLGVRLSENFRWPFLARNPSEFWARWHITLTSWFRDYVHRSLGGIIRTRPARTFANTVFVMSLVGFWHGAGWNFLVFGFVSGLMVAAYQHARIFSPVASRGPLLGDGAIATVVSVAFNFVFHAMLLAIIFRAPDLQTAWQVVAGIFANDWRWPDRYNFYLAMLVLVWVFHIVRGSLAPDRESLQSRPLLKLATWVGLILLAIWGGVENTEKFIYFRF